MIGTLPVKCSRCMPCRIAKKRLWMFRLELEQRKHLQSCVATLTYSDKNLPEGGTLVPQHVQKWIRSTRKMVAPEKIRYFVVGEYGKKKQRPHYHAILYNLSADVGGGPVTPVGRIAGVVKKAWKYGNSLVDDCSSEAMAYVAGYVTKKLHSEDIRGKNLVPEFTRMSLRPGIGAGAVKDIARAMDSDAGLQFLTDCGDVPHALRNGSKIVPLGRYLRGLLRKELRISVDGTSPKEVVQTYWKKMWAMRKEAENDPARKAQSFKQYLVDINAQKIFNLETRTKIFAGKDSL